MSGGPKLRLRTDRVEWREVEGELVVLDAETSTFLAGNRSATTLWRALAAGAERDELVEQLVTTFELDPAAAAADVDRFLADLAERDLLEQ